MAIWYNEPKDGELFATATVQDWNDISTTLQFSEAKIVEAEDKYYIFCFATACNGLIKVGEKNWQFEPQLMRWEIARKTVQAWNSKEKKKVDREQSAVEKLMCKIFADIDLSKAYQGNLTFQNGGMVQSLLDGKQAGTGKEITPEIADLLLGGFRTLEEIDSCEKLPESLEVPKQKSWSGGSKTQTEAEKLTDRFTFIKNQLSLAGYQGTIESVLDLHSAVLKEAEVEEPIRLMVSRTLEMCFKLMA